MNTLLRTPATPVWIVLVAATVVSWSLGNSHGFGGLSEELTGVVILAIAFVKIRFIGVYFMELREAPLYLRGLLELYCAVVATVVIGLFVLA